MRGGCEKTGEGEGVPDGVNKMNGDKGKGKKITVRGEWCGG